MFRQCIWWPKSFAHYFVHSMKTNISSPEINLSTLNRPFPSWCKSPFQSEARCKAIDMKMTYYSHANKTHFHHKGFWTLPRFESESFDFSGQIRQLNCQWKSSSKCCWPIRFNKLVHAGKSKPRKKWASFPASVRQI